MTRNDYFYPHQYGFRSNHSTEIALIELHNKLTSEIDNKKMSIGVFIDLTKAFDTVPHNILLAKLERYGIRGIPLHWFSNNIIIYPVDFSLLTLMILCLNHYQLT